MGQNHQSPVKRKLRDHLHLQEETVRTVYYTSYLRVKNDKSKLHLSVDVTIYKK